MEFMRCRRFLLCRRHARPSAAVPSTGLGKGRAHCPRAAGRNTPRLEARIDAFARQELLPNSPGPKRRFILVNKCSQIEPVCNIW